MVGVAVKVIDCPAQAVDGLAVMFTDATRPDDTVMVIVLEVAGEPVAQLELEVITTVTLSPLFSVVDVNVEEVAPVTSVPFTCH